MRRRRIVKCGGAVACVVIAATWFVSLFLAVIFPVGGVDVALGGGSFVFSSFESGTGFHWFRLPPGGTVFWAGVQYVPLWIPFVVIAIPTFIAWRSDRKPPPGHCACGYNLTGNVSGVCSECGETVETTCPTTK